MERILVCIYYGSLALLVIVGGGLVFERLADVPGPIGDDRLSWTLVAGINGILAVGAVGLGIWLGKRHRRRFWFGNLIFVCWLPLTFGFVELLFRGATPDWPALALHGVQPSVSRQAWGYGLNADDVGFNSWGQRDRERTPCPVAGTYRIAFIGDSFLEESSQPVSLVAERMLNRRDCEIINLGVSATQPDEYYYRLRSVALPLGCQHCVVWLFSGNDFVDEPRTLASQWGVCAVSPRPSLLSRVGCRSINHLLTNWSRPVIQAWFAAGDLAMQEANMYEAIRRADDHGIRQGLLQFGSLPPAEFSRLQARLLSPEITQFFDMLRTPDAGRFRSYYLTAGVWSASVGDGQWPQNSETAALYWVEEMQRTCRSRGVKLTVVVIPEAFQVDSRMAEQWSPLTDMRNLTRPCREAADRFCVAARDRGLDVLDLHPVFEDVAGTYLNLDGHWSEAGVELAAGAIVEHLNSQLP
ncbi:MAG: hypothetical protein ABI614_11070 [Planctomycetota bacterium]